MVLGFFKGRMLQCDSLLEVLNTPRVYFNQVISHGILMLLGFYLDGIFPLIKRCSQSGAKTLLIKDEAGCINRVGICV